MTFGRKIQKLRTEKSLSVSQLARYLGVSEEAVQSWEADRQYPEVLTLMRLSGLFSCSVDSLLKDGENTSPVRTFCGSRSVQYSIGLTRHTIDKKSRLSIGSLPLWHLHFGLHGKARGIIAVGLRAEGLFSFGVFSAGALAFGKYFAAGDHAEALIALGQSAASGSLFAKTGALTPEETETVSALLDETVPGILSFAKKLVQYFLRS